MSEVKVAVVRFFCWLLRLEPEDVVHFDVYEGFSWAWDNDEPETEAVVIGPPMRLADLAQDRKCEGVAGDIITSVTTRSKDTESEESLQNKFERCVAAAFPEIPWATEFLLDDFGALVAAHLRLKPVDFESGIFLFSEAASIAQEDEVELVERLRVSYRRFLEGSAERADGAG